MCQAYQFDKDTKCHVGAGTTGKDCDSDRTLDQVNGQMLQHGSIEILIDTKAPGGDAKPFRIMGLTNLGEMTVKNVDGKIDHADATKHCKYRCYADISCQFWQYSKTDGCWHGVAAGPDDFTDARMETVNLAGFIDGQLAMWRESGIFADEEKLKIASITPSWAAVGDSVEITIEGNALESVSKVTVGGEPVKDFQTAEDGKSITATLPKNLKENLYNVEIEATGMNTSTLLNGLRIGGDEPQSDAQEAGCSARPQTSPTRGLVLVGLMGLLFGLRRRSSAV
jgi:MYXO-CTERM domain-containing protein